MADIRPQRPLYYRFAVSPQTGEVNLSHNYEGHPADVRYHPQMAFELNEPNLIHGYAFRIGNGWRISDYESNPIEDPWVTRRVADHLGQVEGPRPLVGPNTPQTADFA